MRLGQEIALKIDQVLTHSDSTLIIARTDAIAVEDATGRS